MKLALHQLAVHLKQALQPVYLVSGNEPLLVQETVDQILLAAKQQGINETLRFTVDANFDWSLFREASMTESLFETKQVIVLRLISPKLGDAGRKVLQAYVDQPPADKKLFIISEKLDAAALNTTWFKTLNKVGVFLPIWPLQAGQLSGWIRQRLQQLNISADAAAVSFLAKLTEGNLLSTAQLIEKLKLLYPGVHLTVEHVREVGADTARFSVFDLVDKISQGDTAIILRTLSALRTSGVEPILILWAIARKLRELLKVQPEKHTLYGFLQAAARIDWLIKGVVTGSVWDELSDLALAMAGVPVVQTFNA